MKAGISGLRPRRSQADYLLLTTHYSLLTTYYLLLTTDYLISHLLLTTYLLFNIYYSLLTTYYLLPDLLLLTPTYYLLLTTGLNFASAGGCRGTSVEETEESACTTLTACAKY